MTCFVTPPPVPPRNHNSQSLSLALESDFHSSPVEIESLFLRNRYIFKKLTKDTKVVVHDWDIIMKE